MIMYINTNERKNKRETYALFSSNTISEKMLMNSHDGLEEGGGETNRERNKTESE